RGVPGRTTLGAFRSAHDSRTGIRSRGVPGRTTLGAFRSAHDSQNERQAERRDSHPPPRDPAGMMATAAGDHRPDTSVRQAAWTAATSLLVMSVLSPIGFFYVFPRLISRTSIA